jgi:hypothetical protein
VTNAAHAARSMWTLFEPVHAVIYFAPQGRTAFEQAGLRGFWRGYFAGRAAPLGPVGAAVVGASFFNFAPGMVARAIPGVWELISPEQALRVRAAGASHALGALLAGQEAAAEAAADLLWRAVGELDCAGRVLAAANVGLPAPWEGTEGSGALGRLWQAATVLREHRGDGHWAALAAADIDGCEAVVLRCGLDLRREDLQPIRGWTDEEWDAARDRLAGRGLMPGRDADQRGPGGTRRGGSRHRPGRVAALGPARRRGHGRTRRAAPAAGAGVRERGPLSQPHGRTRAQLGGLTQRPHSPGQPAAIEEAVSTSAALTPAAGYSRPPGGLPARPG